MRSPDTSTRPHHTRRRHTLPAILATMLALAGCASPSRAPRPAASPSPHTGRSSGWYAASPTPTHNRGQLFISSAGNHILGSNTHVLAVGRHICRALPDTTITPLTALIATGEHITSDHAEQAITDAITLLCTPIHPTGAEQNYLNDAATLDASLTTHPDLTIYRGHDICYLLDHHTTKTTTTIATQHRYARATTAPQLVALARRDLCHR